ncbi:MAG: nucleotide exchange factor GrpE, partial [Flavobacteriales bacterium]|nr:nucleotide exchange factor GrpE [Flavobacteriales bacterium]
MTENKKNENKTIEETQNTEAVNSEETTTKSEVKEQEEIKPEPTTEELLAIEKDKNLRLFAEFENFRRRNAKERIELFSSA